MSCGEHQRTERASFERTSERPPEKNTKNTTKKKNNNRQPDRITSSTTQSSRIYTKPKNALQAHHRATGATQGKARRIYKHTRITSQESAQSSQRANYSKYRKCRIFHTSRTAGADPEEPQNRTEE